MNKYASSTEIRQIVTDLDIDDSEFYIDLMVSSFYCLQLTFIFLLIFLRNGFLIDVRWNTKMNNIDIN